MKKIWFFFILLAGLAVNGTIILFAGSVRLSALLSSAVMLLSVLAAAGARRPSTGSHAAGGVESESSVASDSDDVPAVTDTVCQPEPSEQSPVSYEPCKMTPSLAEVVHDLRDLLRQTDFGMRENPIDEHRIPKPDLLDNILLLLGNIRENEHSLHENVEKSYDISDNLSKNAAQAFDLAEKVKRGIDKVTNSLKQSISLAHQLEAHSHQIGKIIEFMSNISSKIHVLSINASIVSARAGIHGKGFEVVAKEIRMLSQETDRSLGQIDELVKTIRKLIGNIVDETSRAGADTNDEIQNLVSVAGSLQGILLAVEVINTVSGISVENSGKQETIIENLKSGIDELATSLQAGATHSHEVDDIKKKIAAILDASSDAVGDESSPIDELEEET